MLLWAIVHSIFEEAVGDEYPILQHVFYGRTEEAARGVYRAHMRTDAFLRGCQESGRWDGVNCRTAVGVFRYDTATKTFRSL